MKKEEIAKLDTKALRAEIRKMVQSYSKLKFLVKTGKESDTAKVRSTRRTIARLNTFLNAQ